MQTVALIHHEDAAWGVSFPDFPGCVSAGESLDAALRGANEALALHIEGMIAEKHPVPEARTLDALRADPAFVDDFVGADAVALVPVDLPGRVVKVTITIEDRLLTRLDAAARREGGTRSGYIAAAVRERLAG